MSRGYFKRKQHRQPSAGRAAADHRRQRVEVRQQRVQIVDPHLIFRLAAVERHIGRAAVAPVVDEYAIASRRHLLRERTDICHFAPPARRQCDPGSAFPEDFVVDVDAIDGDNRHGRAPVQYVVGHDSVT